jgi:hypothetical protein
VNAISKKKNVSGQKRKQQVYQPKNSVAPVLLLEGPSAEQANRVEIPAEVVGLVSEHETTVSENSVDSNKKMQKGSADQAGAVEQPRQTQ